MVHASSRRFVKVAPPTVHAGVGNALREAFAMDGEVRSLAMFEDLAGPPRPGVKSRHPGESRDLVRDCLDAVDLGPRLSPG